PACATCPPTSSRATPAAAAGSLAHSFRLRHVMLRARWQASAFGRARAVSGVSDAMPSHAATTRRHALLLLLAYPGLAIAGAVTRRQIFPLLALVVLLTVVMLPRLASQRALPWLT